MENKETDLPEGRSSPDAGKAVRPGVCASGGLREDETE